MHAAGDTNNEVCALTQFACASFSVKACASVGCPASGAAVAKGVRRPSSTASPDPSLCPPPPAPAPASAPACDHGVVGRHPAGGQRPAQEMAKLSSRIVHGCPPRQWEVLRHTAQEAAMSSGREQRAAKAKMKTHDVSKTM